MKLVSLDALPHEAITHNQNIRKKVMVGSGELGNVMTFAQAVVPPGEVVNPHHHEEMDEVFFVESGLGLISIDGTDHELSPGICAVVNAMETHAIWNTGETDLILTYFGVRAAGN